MTNSPTDIPMVSPPTHRLGWIGTGVMGLEHVCEPHPRRLFHDGLQPHQAKG